MKATGRRATQRAAGRASEHRVFGGYVALEGVEVALQVREETYVLVVQPGQGDTGRHSAVAKKVDAREAGILLTKGNHQNKLEKKRICVVHSMFHQNEPALVSSKRPYFGKAGFAEGGRGWNLMKASGLQLQATTGIQGKSSEAKPRLE